MGVFFDVKCLNIATMLIMVILQTKSCYNGFRGGFLANRSFNVGWFAYFFAVEKVGIKKITIFKVSYYKKR
jgi:hypothetical protein